MNARTWLPASLAASGALALAGLYAAAQPPAIEPATRTGTVTVVTARPDGTLVEQTPDGKILRTTVGRQPNVGFVPWTNADGKAAYVYGGGQGDAESQQIVAQELAAAQEARALTAQYAQADSDSSKAELKTRLRDKLLAIFDLQQKRRAREIAQIEERLGKLKETMKKRDTSKEPIVDRRLDQLTGGVDELGWEETGGIGYPALPGAAGVHYGQPNNLYAPSAGVPLSVPNAPGAGVPAVQTLPAPVPVPPRATPSAGN